MTLQPTASIHMPIIGAEIHQRIPWFPLEQPIYLIMDGTREAVGQYTRTLSYQFNVMINNNQCVLQNLMPWILASGWVYNQWSRECTTMQDKMQMAAAAALRGSSRGETPVVTLPLWKERLHCQVIWQVGLINCIQWGQQCCICIYDADAYATSYAAAGFHAEPGGDTDERDWGEATYGDDQQRVKEKEEEEEEEGICCR